METHKRAVNLDLLRILSMFLIIFLHSIDHSGVLEAADAGATPAFLYVRFAYQLTQVCVNLFVMISGYFLVTAEFKLEKLAVLWLEVVFYSFVIKLVFMMTGERNYSLVSLISCFLPIITGRYWFMTIYFGLYLLFPFLNMAIRSMTKNRMMACNIALFLLFSVWISIYPSFAGMNSGRGWGLPWFVVLYFAGAWFRLHYTPNGKWGWKLAFWPILSLIVLLALIVGRQFSGAAETIARNWFKYDSIPAYLATLCVFAAFLNMDIKSAALNRWLTKISANTLGVYLIHAHADLSPWLWDTLDLPRRMQSAAFPLIQIGLVAAVFAVCSAIDMLRSKTIGRLEKSVAIDRICSRVTACAKRVFAFISRTAGV